MQALTLTLTSCASPNPNPNQLCKHVAADDGAPVGSRTRSPASPNSCWPYLLTLTLILPPSQAPSNPNPNPTSKPGTFWISLEDFVQQFDNVDVCQRSKVRGSGLHDLVI